MTYQPQWYTSPLNLPEATSGKMQVRHRIIPAGERVNVIGMRQALTRNVRPVYGTTTTPLRIHELVEADHGIWMTDLPEELNQIQEMLYTVRPKGRVLVGGLGLGIVASTVSQLQAVEHVTVVERDADVNKLCSQGHHFLYELVQADIRGFLEDVVARFDYYLLDTWAGTNEGTWWEQVVPLRRAIRQHWGKRPKVHCWAEDIMRGQVVQTLTRTEPHWWYKYLPVPMTQHAALGFVLNVGLPQWEKKYGAAVDRFAAEETQALEDTHA